MSTSRFAGLKAKVPPAAPESPPPVAAKLSNDEASAPSVMPAPVRSGPRVSSVSPSREGKRAVVGYFSKELNKALHILALDQETSIQGLIGEAIDDLMRKYGKHPFGER
jgi:hypothetical protein